MKKINMAPFKVTVRDMSGITKEVTYGLKESMVEVLFHPGLKLNSYNLLKQEDFARKIIACGDELILEDGEYENLKKAMEMVEGWGKNDVEMVKRVMEPETVIEAPKVA